MDRVDLLSSISTSTRGGSLGCTDGSSTVCSCCEVSLRDCTCSGPGPWLVCSAPLFSRVASSTALCCSRSVSSDLGSMSTGAVCESAESAGGSGDTPDSSHYVAVCSSACASFMVAACPLTCLPTCEEVRVPVEERAGSLVSRSVVVPSTPLTACSTRICADWRIVRNPLIFLPRCQSLPAEERAGPLVSWSGVVPSVPLTECSARVCEDWKIVRNPLLFLSKCRSLPTGECAGPLVSWSGVVPSVSLSESSSSGSLSCKFF
ncbi:hypothetical protein [Candidatus Ichthyocystis sparus]|uniref:hypothetical protein n=1 Tax=Candidatus Ichthyocystis sparus TaxID=1561004 RepID=UPI000B881943|nr:hypothetical protein [Candidatus Ichthyocystis sparus]